MVLRVCEVELFILAKEEAHENNCQQFLNYFLIIQPDNIIQESDE